MRTTGLARFIAVSLLAHAAAALVIAPWPGREATEPVAVQPGAALAIRLVPATVAAALHPPPAGTAEPVQGPAGEAVAPDAVAPDDAPAPADDARALLAARVATEGDSGERPTGEPPSEPEGGADADEGEAMPFQQAVAGDHGPVEAQALVDEAAEPQAAGRLADRLREAVETHFHYPALARRRGMEGEVVIGLRVEVDGRLTAIRVVSSSGHRLLDHAAVESLTRAARLADARGVPDGGVELTLPVRYRLVDA